MTQARVTAAQANHRILYAAKQNKVIRWTRYIYALLLLLFLPIPLLHDEARLGKVLCRPTPQELLQQLWAVLFRLCASLFLRSSCSAQQDLVCILQGAWNSILVCFPGKAAKGSGPGLPTATSVTAGLL